MKKDGYLNRSAETAPQKKRNPRGEPLSQSGTVLLASGSTSYTREATNMHSLAEEHRRDIGICGEGIIIGST